MPYQFDFDSAQRILRCRMEGVVTDEELKEYYRDVERHSVREEPLGGILDLSAVTSLDVSPNTIRELAKLPPAMPNPLRPRVVIAPSPPVFGIARMFEMQGQDTRPSLHVVRTEKEAMAILGITQTKFGPIQTE